MAVTLKYSIVSTDSAGKGANVIGITSVSVSETVGSGASRTLSVTVKGKRKDSNYSLNRPYCNGSSSLSNFSSGIGSTLGGTELTFCTFKITVSASESGTASLGSSYYIDVGGSSSSAGPRSIRVTFNSVSGLTAYIPTYYIYYRYENGNAYTSASALKGNKLTIRSTGPSKSSSSNKSTFNITGDANNGYFETTSTTTTSITATKTITTSYNFSTWNTEPDGTGTTYSPGTQVTMSSNIYLYPIYNPSKNTTYSNNAISALAKPTRNDEESATYIVTYDANGGTVDTNLATATTIRRFYFGGWATSKTATSANAATSYTSAKTLYAYWTYIDTKGSVTLPTPTRTGYEFIGWATTSNATSADIGTGTYEPSATITIYAVWKANGNIRIYVNNTDKYKMAMVYIYAPTSASDTKPWKLAIPYLKDGTVWKIVAG